MFLLWTELFRGDQRSYKALIQEKCPVAKEGTLWQKRAPPVPNKGQPTFSR